MADDNIQFLKEAPLKIDLSGFQPPVFPGLQKMTEEYQKETERAVEAATENRQRLQRAIEQTAENTEKTNKQLKETNDTLQDIIKNQNKLIGIQEKQLEELNAQLETAENQLAILREIFTSSSDNLEAEAEIAALLQEQIDSHHPVKEYLLDKAGDLAVAGVTLGVPMLWASFKTYLAAKGIPI